MIVKSKEEQKKRHEMLADLRNEHSNQFKKAQEMLKQQQSLRKAIKTAIQDGPLTVPQISHLTEIPAHEVLWHVAAMKKYGLLAEEGLDEDEEYFLYGLTEGVKE